MKKVILLGSRGENMELPRRFLNNLKKRIEANREGDLSKYTGEDGVRLLANDVGDALELLDEKEARYVINNSYDAICYDTSINEKEWKRWIVDGMGEHHKKLQEETLKQDVAISKKTKGKTEIER